MDQSCFAKAEPVGCLRKLFFRFLALCFAGLLAGCLSATKSVITEYDADGRVECVTETSESVVTSLTKSTANKTVVAWESGWAAYVSASAATITPEKAVNRSR